MSALREPIHRFYAGALSQDALLGALVAQGPWLVFADAGRLAAIALDGKPNAFVWTDREALDAFLAKGGSRIVAGGKTIDRCIETWDRGFYIFHDFAPTLDCFRINPLLPAPDGITVEPPQFDRVRRLARDALIADVLRAGPRDPRFARVTKKHDDYRIVLLPDGSPMSVDTEPGSPAAVVVFSSGATLDRFLAANPAPAGLHFHVLTMDGVKLFSQLRDTFRAGAVAFDIGSASQTAFDGSVCAFVLEKG